MDKTRILLVEDDEDILKINTVYLNAKGYELATAQTLQEAHEALIRHKPHLIVLDVQLPDGSGVDFCKQIRPISDVPIIFLTCFDQESDKVDGLMAGGDDYMIKPYGLLELEARIQANLRRVQIEKKEDVYRYGSIQVNTLSQRVYCDGKDVRLTQKEYQLLSVLIKNIGHTVETEVLYKKVWDLEAIDPLNVVRVHISALRRKLKLDYDSDLQIKTVRNVGYCLDYEKE